MRRAKANAAKPQGMFGKQNADAAPGRKQTEAACLGVICVFAEEPSLGNWKERGRRWGGEGREAPWLRVCPQSPGFQSPWLNSTLKLHPIFLALECPQLEHERDIGLLRAAEV